MARPKDAPGQHRQPLAVNKQTCVQVFCMTAQQHLRYMSALPSHKSFTSLVPSVCLRCIELCLHRATAVKVCLQLQCVHLFVCCLHQAAATESKKEAKRREREEAREAERAAREARANKVNVYDEKRKKKEEEREAKERAQVRGMMTCGCSVVWL